MTDELTQLRQIARWVDPKVDSINADTQITSRFRGRLLAKFWNACQCQSGGRLPDLLQRPGSALYQKHLKPLRNYVIVLGTLLWLVQYPVADIPLLYMFVTIYMTLVVALVWYVLCGILVFSINAARDRPASAEWPLPQGITTFGKLADVLNGVRGGWCKKCEFELAGIESDKCPQCETVKVQ